MLQRLVLQRQEDMDNGTVEEQQLSSCQDGPLRVTDLGVIPARTAKPHTLFARRIGGQSALRCTKLVVLCPSSCSGASDSYGAVFIRTNIAG
jgi:hypothetical protein